MAFIETPLTAKVALRGRLFGNDVINTLWFQRTDEGEYVSIDLENLTNAVYDWWVAQMADGISKDYVIADITATAQWSPTAPSFIFVPPISTDGELPDESATSSNCFTISFLTNARGRSWRGRNYISGIAFNDIGGNTLSVSRADFFRDAYQELNSYTLPLSSQHVVCSHYSGGVARAEGVTIPVTGYRYHDLNIDSQRRRLNGRGS